MLGEVLIGIKFKRARVKVYALLRSLSLSVSTDLQRRLIVWKCRWIQTHFQKYTRYVAVIFNFYYYDCFMG